VHFLERDVPRYATHREAAQVPNVRVSLYKSVDELQSRFAQLVRDADVVIVGAYVPDGIAVSRWVLESARGLTAFYDLAAPITLADLETGTCEYMSKSLVPQFGLYLSSTGGPTLRRIEREFAAKRAVPLYCAIDPLVYAPEPRSQRWQLGYLGTYSADRQPALAQLLIAVARHDPELQCVVAGPLYPSHIEWPANIERIEHVGSSQHRAFYTACGWTLNLTRHEMAEAGWSPSVRLFEAAACGVPILSDPWDGLDEVFEPGKEILIAHDTDDVIRALRRPDGREIGERARARVIAAHTAAHRAAAFERYLQEAR
jgi:spore maturation protein CgeB